jgi:hypothetical protein
VPVVGAGLSLVVAGTITAAALASLVSYNPLERKNLVEISERNQDLSVLFLNAIGNLLTAGILNAVLIPMCARDLKKRYGCDAEKDPTSTKTVDSDLYDDGSIASDSIDDDFYEYGYNADKPEELI